MFILSLSQFLTVISFFLALYQFPTVTNSHSFLECVDYQGVINGQDYSDDSCQAYPRRWTQYTEVDFAFTTSKTNRIDTQTTLDLCKWDRISLENDYSDERPMASYNVGQTVRIIWPAKNHASYECFTSRPDYGLKLYLYPYLYDSNTQESNDINDWTLLLDWHEPYAEEFATTNGAGIAGIPFQSCPQFCQDTDAAPCFGMFLYCLYVYAIFFCLFALMRFFVM